MVAPQEFLMVNLPRPEARAMKPGMAARTIDEYFILATVWVYLDANKECLGRVYDDE